MRIRNVNPSHIADLIRIGQELNLSPWSAASYLEELKNPDSIIFRLADDDNGTVGFIVGRMIAGGTDEVVAEAEIYNIAVNAGSQDRGLGQLLLDHFLDSVKSRNCHAVWLEVRESNTKAIGFYKKNGFQKVQTRNHFYENPREHAFLMKLSMA